MAWTFCACVCGLMLSLCGASAQHHSRNRLPQDIHNWRYFREGQAHPARFWDREVLRMATGTVDFGQLARVVRKLNAGLPIVIVAFGSSITADFGGIFESRNGMVRSVVPIPVPLHGTDEGFLQKFMLQINATWPHAGHLVYNAAIHGESFLGFAQASCLESQLPNVTVDLVVADFLPRFEARTAEFSELHYNESTLALEQFMWRIFAHYQSLNLSAPAYVFLKPVTYGYTHNGRFECLNSGCNPANCTDFASPFSPVCQANGEAVGEWGNEARIVNIVKYYGQTLLSMRFLYYGARNIFLSSGLSDCDLAERLYVDIVHPSLLGEMLYADMLVNLLADAESAMLSTAPRTTPPNRTPAMAVSQLSLMPEYTLMEGGRQVWRMRCYGEAVPNPWATELNEAALGRLHALEVLLHSGWEHVDQQMHVKQGGSPKHKPGWVSTTVGSELQVQVDTDFSQGSPVGLASQLAVATLMFLESYEHMGTVEVACVSGCVCPALVIDAHNPQRVSVSVVRDMPNISPHRLCLLRLKILPTSNSPNGEHKFKLIQVVVKVHQAASA